MKSDSQMSNAVPPDGSSNKQQLTEKQLRKLEWEKKLAEQKSTESDKNLSKAELKAKRREQQETQRLAKVESKKIESKSNNENTTPKPTPTNQSPKVKVENKGITISPKKDIEKKVASNKVQLVQHLYNEPKTISNTISVNTKIHPYFIRLGTQYMNHVILGSNARCLALLSAIRHLVKDIQIPSKQEFGRYLESTLQTCISYLNECRPLAVSMTNALKHFKLQVAQISTSIPDNEKRLKLLHAIDNYITDDIKKAGDAISIKVREKIADGDVILTYSCSSLIRKILLEAHQDGKQFEVIIVDGKPLLEGREMLRRLVKAGIKCSYILINAVCFAMASVTKVLLGAHALLTNGFVMSRIGTAQVALVAQAYNRPVLVCCETYKFSEKVQTDAFVYNEIGNEATDETRQPKTVENTKLKHLSLLYDVTPPDFVTAVVTELAILPCTSVPVVLRINANEGL